MSSTVLVVHLDIVPEHFEEFLSIARAHGERSRALEPGCRRFEVLVDGEGDHRAILVEVYDDDAALEAHWNSTHMAAYLERVEGMIAGRQRHRCRLD